MLDHARVSASIDAEYGQPMLLRILVFVSVMATWWEAVVGIIR